MGYIERVMGEREQIVYRTRHHWTLLLKRIFRWLFIFAILLALGLAVFIPKLTQAGDDVRHIVGLIILCGLVVPLIWLIRNWVRRDPEEGALRALWRPLLVAAAMLTAGLILWFKPGWWQVAYFWFAAAILPLFLLVRVFLVWLNQQLLITNRRVMVVQGIVNKHVRDSALEKVNDVDMNQSFIGRLLGYGTVKIITGSDVGINEFVCISNPARFKRAMLNAKEQLHVTMPGLAAEEGIAVSQASPSTPAPAVAPGAAEAVAAWASAIAAADIPGTIQELDELRQKGIITEDEFQAKKKELLERL
jgi:hypothetical protein